MDRRQRKSREAIYQAFNQLLLHKRYEQITVQDIIDEADISRSTFYAHFETKDMLLKAMCGDIFDHLFAGDLCGYPDQAPLLQPRLAHLLWHLREQKTQVLGILSCEGGTLFMEYFKERLQGLFSIYLQEFSQAVPKDFLLNHLVGSFCEAVRWWAHLGMGPSPEAVAEYYMHCVR